MKPNIKVVYIISVFLVSLSSLSFAEDMTGTLQTSTNPTSLPGIVRSQTFQQATNDNTLHQEIQLEYHNLRRDFWSPFPEEKDKGWDFGISSEYHSGRTSLANYSGQKALGLMGYKFSPDVYTSLGLGAHQLQFEPDKKSNENDADLKSVLPSYDLQTFAHLTGKITLQTRFARDFLYQDWVQAGAVSDKLSATQGFITLEDRAHDRLRFVARSSVLAISDGNNQRSGDLSALYGISPDLPWVWLGLGGQLMGFDQQTDLYWSPNRIWSIGPRFESWFPIGSKMSVAASANFNEHEGANEEKGYDYSTSLKFSYGNREGMLFDITYSRMGTLPGAGNWIRDDLTLAASSSL